MAICLLFFLVCVLSRHTVAAVIHCFAANYFACYVYLFAFNRYLCANVRERDAARYGSQACLRLRFPPFAVLHGFDCSTCCLL